jgi:sulfoxide reductase catalytic subunit YedY
VRRSHYPDLFFLFMLIRSGLSILMDHPPALLERPLHTGIRFTPLEVPTDRIWTAKDIDNVRNNEPGLCAPWECPPNSQ